MFRVMHFILVLAALATVQAAHAQGCSDAGACTMMNLTPAMHDTMAARKDNIIKAGVSYGMGDKQVKVWSGYLEYIRVINKKFTADIKVSGMAQAEAGRTFGPSDVYVNAVYNGMEHMFITAGVKLPLSDGNNKEAGMSLPMDYQTSLGTVDMIAGIGYEIKALALVFAFQQPLTQNKNAFLSTDYPAYSKFSQFQSTNKYKRRGDVLLRASYAIALGKKWKITPGILPIYHIGDDEFTDGAGVSHKIEGSQGLTLNGILYAGYTIDRSNSFELSFGTPFIARKARPDGLTRKYVIALEYARAF